MNCDKNCPIHGTARTHGKIFTGTVVSTKMTKTATVEWQKLRYVQKYERYAKTRTKVKAHNPQCINAQKGDVVKIQETRKLSRTKNFAIIEKLGKQKLFEEKQSRIEQSKKREKEEENESS
ncbi:30S ribosomal protein S17 [Candidatus Woesearchaeota archaeon]|nr:30S ribosomal protein S17 [Candidatus Woesearchaeota archaeon]